MFHLFAEHHLQPELQALREHDLARRDGRRQQCLDAALPGHPAFARTRVAHLLRALADRLEPGTAPRVAAAAPLEPDHR